MSSSLPLQILGKALPSPWKSELLVFKVFSEKPSLRILRRLFIISYTSSSQLQVTLFICFLCLMHICLCLLFFLSVSLTSLITLLGLKAHTLCAPHIVPCTLCGHQKYLLYKWMNEQSFPMDFIHVFIQKTYRAGGYVYFLHLSFLIRLSHMS